MPATAFRLDAVIDRIRVLGAGMTLGCLLSGRMEPWGFVGIGVTTLACFAPLLLGLFGWSRVPDVGHFQEPKLAPRKRQVIRDLRAALDGGMTMEQAVRFLHTSKSYEMTFLWPAVVSVTGRPQQDAIRLVVEATTKAGAS